MSDEAIKASIGELKAAIGVLQHSVATLRTELAVKDRADKERHVALLDKILAVDEPPH
jgi:hypothetical protein